MPVIESELCTTISLIAGNSQKVSRRVDRIKKPQKVYESCNIPHEESIIAYCEGTLPLFRMSIGFVIFSNKAFYPSTPTGLSPNFVPYDKLYRYIITQDNVKDAVFLRDCNEHYMIYSSTLFAKNIAGCEIKNLLAEIQSYYCLHDDIFREGYKKTVENLYAHAKEESRKGDLSGNTKSMLLSLAEKGSEDSVRFLAESQFRLCDIEKYRSYIQGLPISSEMQEKYLQIPFEFFDSLQNDLANPACEFSDAYLKGIIDTIEKQNNVSEFERRFFRIVKTLALCRTRPIAARYEYQKLKQTYPDENWNVLEDAIHFYGSKHMLEIYNQLDLDSDISLDCFQYIDGLNLTPLHYALLLGKNDVVTNWLTSKRFDSTRLPEQTSQIGIWSYGVLSEVSHSSQTEDLLLHTVKSFIELQATIRSLEKEISAGEIRLRVMDAADTLNSYLGTASGSDNNGNLADEEQEDFEYDEEECDQREKYRTSIMERLDELDCEASQKRSELETAYKKMLANIHAYIDAFSHKSSTLDGFIMQIYTQQVNIGDILQQTVSEEVLRMYHNKSYSLLLPDSIHLDAPYRMIKIAKTGIEDYGEMNGNKVSSKA